MPFCFNCGNKLSDTARFCPNCGTRIPDPEPAPQAPPVREDKWEESFSAPQAPSPEVPVQPAVPQDPWAASFAAPEPPAPVFEEPTIVAPIAQSCLAEEPIPSDPVVPGPDYKDAPVQPPAFEDFAPEEPAQEYIPSQEQEYTQRAGHGYGEYQSKYANAPQYAPSAPSQYAPHTEPSYVPPVSNNSVYDTPLFDSESESQSGKAAKVPLFPKKPLSIPRRLLAGLLCILLFVFSLVAAVLGIVRMATTEEAVSHIVDDIPLSSIPADVLIANAPKNKDLVEWLYGRLCDQYTDWESISEDELEEYLDAEIKPFVAEKLSQFLDDLYSNNRDASVTKKEIKKLLISSSDFLYTEFDFYLPETQCEKLSEWIDGFGMSEMADMDYLEDEYGTILTWAYWLTSWYAIALFGILALLMVFLLARTTRSTVRTMGSAGGTLTVLGSILGLVTVVSLLPDFWQVLCGGMVIISVPTAGILAESCMVTLSVLGGGVITLLIRKLLMCIKVRQK